MEKKRYLFSFSFFFLLSTRVACSRFTTFANVFFLFNSCFSTPTFSFALRLLSLPRFGVSLALVELAYFPLPVLLLWVRLGLPLCKLAGLGQGTGVQECNELTGMALSFASGVQK
ncbi:hypothetical protein BO70DRAFT_8300 [Aspergillus heteromorphus CBS 117.55]|uniref:Transmembrane protein n=1 Tax=Aspergillus heteromorphus CBS 117.55 TaxID=1448321 RepID=A0A317X1E7_9EURO|nr:uncharacterized protein BO70DRAFT_8300 [Aspergillus heteromorphus CBS 117.55]PWY92373.1 hypothetical protein BO70DRAFT_8300 [Aspergillus heteromorphus CBS 117.55]